MPLAQRSSRFEEAALVIEAQWRHRRLDRRILLTVLVLRTSHTFAHLAQHTPRSRTYVPLSGRR